MMSFRQMYERLVLFALAGFLFLLFLSVALETNQARSALAGYSFFVMAIYAFRDWHFKERSSRVEIIGCALIGIALEALNYFAP
jgi:uncharacterized membrane protein